MESLEVRSLSIFDFNNIALWRKLNWSEYRWQFFVVVSLLITATTGELVLRQFWESRPETTFRTEAVKRLEEGSVDVIFVGSSHIYTGVDPAYFPYSVVNLSDSALNYQMAEVLCKKYWSRVSQAKLVVIELDAVPVYEDTIARRHGDYRGLLGWDLHANELPLSSWGAFEANTLEQFTTTRVHNLWPYLIKPQVKTDDTVVVPGFHAVKGKLDRKNNEAAFAGLGTEFPEVMVEDNLRSFKRLLIDLREAGVKVKLLRPPFYIDYWQHPKGKQRDKYAEQALEIFLSMPHTSKSDVIDLRYLFQSEEKCFRDLVHVSKYGAKQLSEHLAKVITLKEQ